MAARLRFAISTAAVPDILMIDEALATGDAEFQARSRERVAEIREAAGTVFLVSHSDATVRAMCDRALWLDGGRLVMDEIGRASCRGSGYVWRRAGARVTRTRASQIV